MTTATYSPTRPGVHEGFDVLTMTWARTAFSRYRTYRKTLAELRRMDVRLQEDVGFAGLDLKQVVHHAAYGN